MERANIQNPSPVEVEHRNVTPELSKAILRDEDKQRHAEKLDDADLCALLEKAFEQSRNATTYNLPYLAEARKRFAKPGRRIPVSGQPSWSEWLSEHVGVSDRHVRRLLAAYREAQDAAKNPEEAEQRRLEAEQKKAEAEKKKADAKQKREAAKALEASLAANAVQLAELVASGDLENAQKLASVVLDAVKSGNVSCIPLSGAMPCSGCEQLHSGIAAVLVSEPEKRIDAVARECGVSTTVVRQAATRFGIVPVLAMETEEVANVA